MSTIRALVLSSLAAVALADGLYVHSNELAAHLAKRRQMPQPGTPAYNCHNNCGQSIIAARSPDFCHDKTFLTDYAICLSCAGPDNYNIWVYYDRALTDAASSCGLSTTPDTKKITDVPLAIPAAQASDAATPPSTTTPGGTASSSVLVASPGSSATVSSTSSIQPTTSAINKSGASSASSAVCIKLYVISLLASNLLYAFGF